MGAKTLGQLILELAAETSAPESLVEQVQLTFLRKGMQLSDPCAAFEGAVRDTFLRAAELRQHTARAERGLVSLQERLAKLGQAWERQVEQMHQIKETLAHGGEQLREQAARLRAQAPRGSHLVPARAFAMVPGPNDLQ